MGLMKSKKGSHFFLIGIKLNFFSKLLIIFKCVNQTIEPFSMQIFPNALNEISIFKEFC